VSVGAPTELLAGLEAVAGGALLFFVPGYAISRAVFPEWRIRGPGGARRALETVVLGFVLSIGVTVLAGYLLLNGAPGGFVARWSDPLLEAVLAAVAGAAALVALAEGAFARVPPPARGSEGGPGEEGAWELTRAVDRLRREERSILRRLEGEPESDASSGLRTRLEEIRRLREERLRAREAEYDL
jgi:hypothetical protein